MNFAVLILVFVILDGRNPRAMAMAKMEGNSSKGTTIDSVRDSFDQTGGNHYLQFNRESQVPSQFSSLSGIFRFQLFDPL